MEYKDYFLVIYKEREKSTDEVESESIQRFYSLVKVWQWVTENNPALYCVFEADCIIDES